MRRINALSSLGASKGLATTLIVGGVCAVGVGTAGLVFTPPSASATDSDQNASADNELSPHRRKVVQGLRGIIESSKAVIDARPAPGSTSSDLVLWTEDAADPGAVNQNEVLILTHSDVLEAIVALSKPTENKAAPALPTEAMFDPHLAKRWRSTPNVRTNVLATNVKTMRIEPGDDLSDESSLSIRLTWAGGSTDESQGRPSETMFSVVTPRVRRAR